MLPRRQLGRTSVQITPLALGAAPLSTVFWGNTEERAIATARRAVEAGIGLIDTAPLYGLGEAEERTGAALRDATATAAGPVARAVAVTTKVGRSLVRDDDGRRAAVFDFSRDAVLRQLEGSLERLGRSHVDVAHVHDPEEHLEQALREAVPALCELRHAGTIGAVSVGTNVVDTARRFMEEADIDAVMVAGRLSLLDRSAEALLDLVAQRGIGYLAAAPFNSGVLARPVPGAWYDYSAAPADVVARVRRLDDLCSEAGIPLRTAALRHPLRFPAVTSVVVGMASPDEVDENVAAMDTPISDELWAAIDAIR